MNAQSIKRESSGFLWLACAFVVAILMLQGSSAAQQTRRQGNAATQAKPRAFDTPEQAAEALVKAAEAYRCCFAQCDSRARWA